MGIPLVIAHFGGGPNYLRLSLESAARFNDEVVLVGDGSNRGLWRSHWNSDHADTRKFARFMAGHVKLSDYPVSYETAFWKRPFMVEAWMKAEGVKELFLIDSDVISFADYSKEVAPLLPADCQATVMVTARNQEIDELWSSLHFSYWTREALEDFTTFSINAYRDPNIRPKLENKYQWHIHHRRPGGVCEMTLLYYWAAKNSETVLNLAKVIDNSVADLAVSSSTNYFDDEYEMRGGFKRLVFRNGVPFGFNKVLNREVRFWCLHCQGEAKAVMRFLQSRNSRALFPDLYQIMRLKGALERKSKSFIGGAVKRLVPRPNDLAD